MMEERITTLERKIREIEARLLGHVPPLEEPKPPEPPVEESDDAPPKED